MSVWGWGGGRGEADDVRYGVISEASPCSQETCLVWRPGQRLDTRSVSCESLVRPAHASMPQQHKVVTATRRQLPTIMRPLQRSQQSHVVLCCGLQAYSKLGKLAGVACFLLPG